MICCTALAVLHYVRSKYGEKEKQNKNCFLPATTKRTIRKLIGTRTEDRLIVTQNL
jgi:hypothetical protein